MKHGDIIKVPLTVADDFVVTTRLVAIHSEVACYECDAKRLIAITDTICSMCADKIVFKEIKDFDSEKDKVYNDMYFTLPDRRNMILKAVSSVWGCKGCIGELVDGRMRIPCSSLPLCRHGVKKRYIFVLVNERRRYLNLRTHRIVEVEDD